MRRSGLGALALLVTIPTSLVVGALPAAAATLSVPSIGGLVADDAQQRVFVGDRTNGKVLAADYSGNLVDSASGIAEVSDLALSPDGQILYAAAWGTHEIVALDAVTLNEVTRYTAATTYGPRHIAFAGGKVWFSYGDQWSGNLGSIDPGTGTVTMNAYPGRMWGQALLDTASAKPNLLAVGQTGISTDSMAVLDTSGALKPEVAWYQGDYTLNDGIGDIDLVPGAAQVLVNGRERQAYANGSFTPSGAYPSGYRADISATGLVASTTGSQVNVFEPNAPLPINTFDADAAALAWAGDESKLFVLNGSGPYVLSVLDEPAVSTPALTVSAPASALRAQQLTVTGTLGATAPLPSDISLGVLRKDMEQPGGISLPVVTVAADGTWSFQDSPAAGGPVTYVVSYAGDADHRAVTSSATVSVSRDTPTLALQPGGTTYAFGQRVVFTAHLGPTYQNRSLDLWVDPYGDDKPRTLVQSGDVNSNGDLTWTLYLQRNTTVTAVYAGDARTSPRTVAVNVKARVAIAVAVARQYKTARIGFHKYFWFHQATSPILTTTMSPYPGRKMRVDFQVMDSGTWRAADSAFFMLASGGKSTVQVAAPNRADVEARIRSSYIRQASGDLVNATTYGRWTYLYFTT